MTGVYHTTRETSFTAVIWEQAGPAAHLHAPRVGWGLTARCVATESAELREKRERLARLMHDLADSPRDSSGPSRFHISCAFGQTCAFSNQVLQFGTLRNPNLSG